MHAEQTEYLAQYNEAAKALNRLTKPLSNAARLRLGMEVLKSMLRDVDVGAREEIVTFVAQQLQSGGEDGEMQVPLSLTGMLPILGAPVRH